MSQGGADQGGTGGSDVAQGGTDQGGAGGTSGSAQGGTGGSDVGQGGTGQGGSGGSGTLPTCVDGETHCDGLDFKICAEDGLYTIPCDSPVPGMNCSPQDGCYGECRTGDVRCSGETAETCQGGSWTTSEVCAFQCVDGACEGSCTPESVSCDGSSVVTCGSDFEYGPGVACPDDLNATATCTGAGVCGKVCDGTFADCDSNGSCESDLSSPATCGSCQTACDLDPVNAAPTCDGQTGCGFTCDSGFGDCTGASGCETQIANDSHNCGGCGITCYGGACNNGACVSDFEVVADFSGPGTRGVLDMVVGPTHVYWWTDDSTPSSTIWRAPKDGSSAPESLVTLPVAGNMIDNALLIDNGLLYWTTDTAIFRMPETGGTPTQISNVGAAAISIADGKLYWNDVLLNVTRCSSQVSFNAFSACNQSKVTTFYTLDLTTLNRTSWTTTQFEYSPVVGVSGNHIFVTRFQTQSDIFPGFHQYFTRVMTLDIDTEGTVPTIVADSVQVNGTTRGFDDDFGQGVVVGDSVTYSTKLRDLGATGLCLDDTFVQLDAVASGGTERLASDSVHAYYPVPNSQVISVTLDGSATVEQIFGNPGQGAKIALDASYVYWSVDVAGERAILRTTR